MRLPSSGRRFFRHKSGHLSSMSTKASRSSRRARTVYGLLFLREHRNLAGLRIAQILICHFQNNVAVAAEYLKTVYAGQGIKKVLILDW